MESAIRYAQVHVVKLLLQWGANIHFRAEYGRTALMIAVMGKNENHVNIAHLLIEKKIDINATDEDKKTALMYAIQHAVAGQDLITIQALLEKGISEEVINMQAEGCFDTETPLGFATRNLNSPHRGKNYATIMMMLLRAGADPTIESDVMKPLDVLSYRRLKNKKLNKLLTKFEQDNTSSLSYNSLPYK